MLSMTSIKPIPYGLAALPNRVSPTSCVCVCVCVRGCVHVKPSELKGDPNWSSLRHSLIILKTVVAVKSATLFSKQRGGGSCAFLRQFLETFSTGSSHPASLWMQYLGQTALSTLQSKRLHLPSGSQPQTLSLHGIVSENRGSEKSVSSLSSVSSSGPCRSSSLQRLLANKRKKLAAF